MIASDPTIDYKEQGYNNRLQATDSLAAKNESFVNAYAFDTNTDRNAVSNYNIRTITADKITAGTMSSSYLYGGTLTLGGTDNGNGLMVVNNSSGSESVKLDNTGITVTGGQILVQNNAGSTTFDAYGLVSVNNFGIYGTTVTSSGSISGTSITDLEYTNFNIILQRTSKIMFIFNIQAHGDTAGGTVDTNGRSNYTVNIGGTAQLPEILFDTHISTYKENYLRKSFSTSFVQTVSAGTTNVKVTGQITGATNLISYYDTRSLNAIVLGT